MSDKIYVGRAVTSFESSPSFSPYSKVILWYEDGKAFIAGDDTGRTLEVDLPWATQAIADNMLAEISGFIYSPFTAEGAVLDPSAELGDGVTVCSIYAPLADMELSFGRGGSAGIKAPAEEEINHEIPYQTPSQRQMVRKFAQTRSLITKTAEEIRLEVFKEIDGVEAAFSELELTVDGIAGRVGDAEGNIAELELTAQGFALDISDLQGNYTEVAATIAGLTVTDQSGTTLINGSLIETTNLHVQAANIDGTLKADQIVLTGSISWGDLDSGVQNSINSAGGISEAEATTLITRTLVSSPTIRGGTFGDLGGDNYLTMFTNRGATGTSSFLEHYCAEYSAVSPIMSMGYYDVLGAPSWGLVVRDRTILHMNNDELVRPLGVWDFSGATVTGLSVVFG